MSVKIEWLDTLTSATEYRVYRNAALLATLPAGTTEYTDNNPLVGSVNYQIRGLVEGEEVLGDTLTIPNTVDWSPTDLDTGANTQVRIYDVGENTTMLTPAAGNPVNGDIVASIRPTNSGSDGRLEPQFSADRGVYREDAKFKWIEMPDDAIGYRDSNQPMVNMVGGQNATLISMIVNTKNATDGTLFEWVRGSGIGDPYAQFFIRQLSSSEAGFRYSALVRASNAVASSLLDGATSRPNLSVVTTHIKWVDGEFDCFYNLESVNLGSWGFGDTPEVDGVSTPFKIFEDGGGRFYGMVIASRNDGNFHQGEVNSLISYMIGKYHGRT